VKILSFSNVSKQYNETQALVDISCSIEQGKIVGIVGPNGAGKTTFIKIALGLIVPDFGQVSVNGFVPSKRDNEFLQSVGFVSGQIQLLDPHVPVVDSIKLTALFKSQNTDNIDVRIKELTKRLNTEHIVHKSARSLSLGERIKSEIIAGIIHNPKILFLDEPTIGLDFESQEEMHALLKELNRELGVTIVITSHYFNDIKNNCSELIYIDQGRIVYQGDMELKDSIKHPILKKYLQKLEQV
jgi:ABC-2 type transport system ATP-binding protein